jgi:hypothetical protein
MIFIYTITFYAQKIRITNNQYRTHFKYFRLYGKVCNATVI